MPKSSHPRDLVLSMMRNQLGYTYYPYVLEAFADISTIMANLVAGEVGIPIVHVNYQSGQKNQFLNKVYSVHFGDRAAAVSDQSRSGTAHRKINQKIKNPQNSPCPMPAPCCPLSRNSNSDIEIYIKNELETAAVPSTISLGPPNEPKTPEASAVVFAMMDRLCRGGSSANTPSPAAAMPLFHTCQRIHFSSQ